MASISSSSSSMSSSSGSWRSGTFFGERGWESSSSSESISSSSFSSCSSSFSSCSSSSSFSSSSSSFSSCSSSFSSSSFSSSSSSFSSCSSSFSSSSFSSAGGGGHIDLSPRQLSIMQVPTRLAVFTGNATDAWGPLISLTNYTTTILVQSWNNAIEFQFTVNGTDFYDAIVTGPIGNGSYFDAIDVIGFRIRNAVSGQVGAYQVVAFSSGY